MKPKNLLFTRRHYCMIIVELACNRSITAEYNETRVLFFFGRAWENDRIRQWLCPEEKDDIKEKRMMMLIGWLYNKGVVFDGHCYRTNIAICLIKAGVLCGVTNYRTNKNYMCMKMPKDVQKESNKIFSDIFEFVTKKMQK